MHPKQELKYIYNSLTIVAYILFIAVVGMVMVNTLVMTKGDALKEMIHVIPLALWSIQSFATSDILKELYHELYDNKE